MVSIRFRKKAKHDDGHLMINTGKNALEHSGEDIASSSGLDEKGLSPAAFHRLTQALERHRVHLRKKAKQRQRGPGVFGPLMAATGNLTSVAAPVQSRLQPDVKRPGYHLSRYLLEDRSSSRPTGVGSARNVSSYSGTSTPTYLPSPSPDSESYDLKNVARNQGRKQEKPWKRKKARVFITHHVSKTTEREDFIMKLSRAMMMFGAPSHRLQAQIKSTADVLDVDISCMYLPDTFLLSFDDTSTGTSHHVKFIRQQSSLDIGKLNDAYSLYWKVIHDELSVADASAGLDALTRRPRIYSWWQVIVFGGMCSSSICIASFGGNFLDAVIVFPLGAFLTTAQLLSGRNELYSNVFEVTISALFSFIAAALALTRLFCYSAIASSSIVCILPGFIVLCGSLEITSRNIVAGSIRMCYAVVYTLFLGFGLAMGAGAFEAITRTRVVGEEDYVCALSHNPEGTWYQQTPSRWWAFLTVPMFSLFLSLLNQAPYNRKELLLLVCISCIGWVTTYLAQAQFAGQSDVIAAIGAFTIGIVANLYARLSEENAFGIMITGILFQVPSGLGNDGLLRYVHQQTAGSTKSYLSGFQAASKLVSVAIGLTVGLGLALLLTHPIQSRRRAGGIFSL